MIIYQDIFDKFQSCTLSGLKSASPAGVILFQPPWGITYHQQVNCITLEIEDKHYPFLLLQFYRLLLLSLRIALWQQKRLPLLERNINLATVTYDVLATTTTTAATFYNLGLLLFFFF